MAFLTGHEHYNIDSDPVVARGIGYGSDNLDEASRKAVLDALWDRPGQEEDAEVLASLEGTGFNANLMQQVITSADVQDSVEEWRVGEAVGQAELEANRGCSFPWNARRDLKNPRASQAGAELVGFHTRPGGTQCFGFGEVKTSSEQRYPPSVTTDLRRQIAALRDVPTVRHNLIRYLVPRMRNAPWRGAFEQSWLAYNRDQRDFAVFGVLVRDVDPDAGDLRGMATDFATSTTAPTTLELRAVYVPDGTLATMTGARR
jgi:hypothetical protein